ncbi:hypothetical protein [Amphibacillus cookii]|uniref:hypothetical protein n=1 Tax=Amphibacillus cookii TaxID=767787 RepID=UPI001958BCD5|nr:hypothetical protein [Amphibacillus cookii]MBM7540944.1 hypothetical protein [Amphibacillus cookii]
MSNKKKLFLLFLVIISIISCLYYFIMQNDEKLIEKELTHLIQSDLEGYQFKFIDNNHALAFYGWGYPSQPHYGLVELEKTMFGWQVIDGYSNFFISEDSLILWEATSLADYFILRGPIHHRVSKLELVNQTSEKLTAEIFEVNAVHNMFYFLLEEKPSTGATLILRDPENEIIEQVDLEFDDK